MKDETQQGFSRAAAEQFFSSQQDANQKLKLSIKDLTKEERAVQPGMQSGAVPVECKFNLQGGLDASKINSVHKDTMVYHFNSQVRVFL